MNISEVDKNIYRGPQPHTKEDWQQLVDLKVSHILDLQTGALWGDGNVLGNQITADIRNIRTWNHPLSSIFPPSKKQIYDAVHLITTARDAGAVIYVHCLAGKDRTGMVCASYKMAKRGLVREAAIDDMKSHGFHFWYFYWVWALINRAEDLGV